MRAERAEIFEHDGGIIQVKITVPLSLKSVNSFLLRDGKGYAWIDPGLNTNEIQMVWNTVFDQLSIKFNEITKIICTHHHPDHFGLTGYAQQHTHTHVYMSETSFSYANLLWKDELYFPNLMHSLFIRHGVREDLTNSIVDNLHWFRSLVYPFPKPSFINHLDSFEINGGKWVCIETNGHAKGQMMLYHAATKTMICGDQVLPHITPHVGVVPGEEDERPLKLFLHSLQHINTYEVERAFGGHGQPIHNWSEKIANIVNHHERRFDKMRNIINEYGEINAFKMSDLVFGQHLHKQPQNLRFAITEIIAHLDYLSDEGHINKKVHHEQITYKKI